MDTAMLTGTTPNGAGELSTRDQLILRQNSAAVGELLTRSEIGSGSPSPIECRCSEKTDAKAEAR